MPWTAVTFLIGAAAISGLPPLNGFVSEFLIFLGAFRGSITTGVTIAVPLLALIAGLALIGGLAVACFTKAFGIVFLGEPRSDRVSHAHDADWTMRLPMLVLAAGCMLIGLFAPIVVGSLQTVLENVTKLRPADIGNGLAAATSPLSFVVLGTALFLALLTLLVVLRHYLLAHRRVETDVTWGCGYAQPTSRMQYTASSFAQPLTDLFRPLLATKKKITPPRGIFPQVAALKTETSDISHEEMYRPLFGRVNEWLSQLRRLQHGKVQLYVLYIAVTLIILLVWELR
jgi:NADH:ubiquinone oxidoreductase subunit 5 (subunit L)/multisubunit Na+/H+ antiporter MnhA subunit